MTGNGFDHDVLIIGSGFGGSSSACGRPTKAIAWPCSKPASAGPTRNSRDVLGRGEVPLGPRPRHVRHPAARIPRRRDDPVRLGGRRRLKRYANTLYVPPRPFFQAKEWSGITDWDEELAPYYDQAARMLGVVRVPYMDTDADRLLREIAGEMGRGDTYNKAPVGVYFGTPGVEVDDPYFGGEGPE